MDRRWFQYGSESGSIIFGQYGSKLMTQQFENFTAQKSIFIYLKIAIKYVYPLVSMEDDQAAGKASSTPDPHCKRNTIPYPAPIKVNADPCGSESITLRVTKPNKLVLVL